MSEYNAAQGREARREVRDLWLLLAADVLRLRGDLRESVRSGAFTAEEAELAALDLGEVAALLRDYAPPARKPRRSRPR